MFSQRRLRLPGQPRGYYGMYVFADFCQSNRLYTTQQQGTTFTTLMRDVVLPADQRLSLPARLAAMPTGGSTWSIGPMARCI
ncbi:MAG: hypothetical protein HZY76_14230 [Anaerolineae bacterium]|nr:MAG: hypothetical protein HZY76_14230 [Anaerolineae bacterium]